MLEVFLLVFWPASPHQKNWGAWLPKFSWELPPVFCASQPGSALCCWHFSRRVTTLTSINTHRTDCEVAKKRRLCFAEIKRPEPPWPAALRLKWRYGEGSSERAFFLTHLRYKLTASYQPSVFTALIDLSANSLQCGILIALLCNVVLRLGPEVKAVSWCVFKRGV